jgi:hypothetical protein
MLNPLLASQSAAPQPQSTFLLVQEIMDEDNYVRLTRNLRALHSLCLGESDKVRLIFSDEPAAKLSEKVFKDVDRESKAMLVPLSDFGFSPKSFMGQGKK